MQPWNFGSRTIKGKSGPKARVLDKTASQLKAEPVAAAMGDATAVAMDAAAVAEPMILEPEWEPTSAKRPPAKKGGPRKAVAKSGKKSGQMQICRDCGQVSHAWAGVCISDLRISPFSLCSKYTQMTQSVTSWHRAKQRVLCNQAVLIRRLDTYPRTTRNAGRMSHLLQRMRQCLMLPFKTRYVFAGLCRLRCCCNFSSQVVIHPQSPILKVPDQLHTKHLMQFA